MFRHLDHYHLDALYRSLSERWTTEHVAMHIAALLIGRVDRKLWQPFDQMARRRGKSAMAERFSQAPELTQTIRTAKGLFPSVRRPRDPGNTDDVRAYLDRLNAALHVSHHSFLHGRLDRQGREDAGLSWSARAYNKRFRFVVRFEQRFARWRRLTRQYRLAQVAKTKLAIQIDRPSFEADVLSACFVAYMTAKLGRRSLFTWGKQPRAYDEHAAALYAHLDHDTAQWRVIAFVHPEPEVLARLSVADRGQLLGAWYDVMQTAARTLDQLVRERPPADLDRLVVRRGDDSSTFNEAAGAFNSARAGWINTLYALDLAHVLDTFAPPKALRLMAADVVWMHQRYGSGGLQPDTRVWQLLPKPWDVMAGRAECTRLDIEHACHHAGVKPDGWITPRPRGVATYFATPELVHGVAVRSPALAARLRKARVFAGPSKWKSRRSPP